MGSLRFTDLQTRPTEVLDLTSLTVDDFQPLVPPFEAAFQAHMAPWRLDGQPRTARRYTTYNNCKRSPLGSNSAAGHRPWLRWTGVGSQEGAPSPRGLPGGRPIGEDLTVLRLEGRHHGHHGVDTAGPLGPLRAKAPGAPEHSRTARALRGLRARLHALLPDHGPQRLASREDLPAHPLRLRDPTRLPRLQPPCHLASDRPLRVGTARLGQCPVADPMPLLDHVTGLRPPGFPQHPGRPAAREPRLEVPPPMGPTPLPPPRGVPGGGAPASRH
jgi:hypothetical protein